jgi:uncharacterized protein (TIGR00299 family) protein
MRTLFFDCFSGISGDMTVGALLDLGLDLGYLRAELAKLPVEGYALRATRVVRANISATKFDVLVDGDGHAAPEAGPAHPHRHGTPGSHRKASGILDMIRSSTLNAYTKRMAAAIFTKLAVSEGVVHGIPPEDVEFHEVGAVDSIIDAVAAAVGFDALGIERFRCSPINVGAGFIHCQHGILPVPAPATADLLRGASIYSAHIKTELVTPTGAAILAGVECAFGPLDGFAAERIGYGAGSKQFQDFPNCLRAMLGTERPAPGRGDLSSPDSAATDSSGIIDVIEADIDDMNPQNYGYVSERLLEAGALDVSVSAVTMKKGRSGRRVQVLAPLDHADALCRILFLETTTIGLRRHRARRSVLERESVTVETPYGAVSVKVARLDGAVVNVAPEYEDCARLAREKRVPLKEVQAAAMRGMQGVATDPR